MAGQAQERRVSEAVMLLGGYVMSLSPSHCIVVCCVAAFQVFINSY